MATTKNITMKQFNGTDYDTLYPKTKIEQVEGAYTQQQILADSTKGLFGLDATAVPDDAFNVLSRFQNGLGNEYVWWKTKSETVDFVNSKNEFWQNLSIYKDNSGSSPQMRDLAYGKSVKVVNGDAVLDEVFTPTSQPTSDNASYWQSIVPFYFKYNGKVCYADAYVGANSNNVAVSAYYTAVIQKTVVTTYGYVNSPDPNAYPPAVSDGYTYTALGQLGAKTEIEIVSYVGTGTYGSSSPSTLTFPRKPKFILSLGKKGINSGIAYMTSLSSGNSYGLLAMAPEFAPSVYKQGWAIGGGSTVYGKYDSENNVLTWYSSDSASYQSNESGMLYMLAVVY